MKELIIDLFGEYEPVYTSGSAITGGFAVADWSYILGVLGFFIVLFCLLKCIGGLLNK